MIPGIKEMNEQYGINLTGTSIFDPVLCEIVYNWYSRKGDVVYDPFAGGSVRGVVAEMLDRRYIGIDLSQRQVDANQITADRLGVCPAWHCDDAKNADVYLMDDSADLVFSCPPYHNLEKYSDHPLDLSNMAYDDFCDAYTDIIRIACRKLKNNRFAVFVVGEIRMSSGAYRDFIGLTKKAFCDNGLHFYNESILLNQYGTAPLRAGLMFEKNRKTAKVHQNVLVFFKGNLKEIRNVTSNDFIMADLTGHLQQKGGDDCGHWK